MRSFVYIHSILLLLTTVFNLTGPEVRGQHNNSKGDIVHSSTWQYMMHDPDASFQATVQAFNRYCEDQGTMRVPGWKQFRRWEYINQFRVQSDGRLPKPEIIMQNLREYRAIHQCDQGNNAGTWTELGPFTLPTNPFPTIYKNGLGRINAIAFHPTDENIIYVGVPSGGLWKTANGGNSWTHLTDAYEMFGVSSILIDPANPNHILCGTGDRDQGSTTDYPGRGVYKSTDGGLTWSPSDTGIENLTVGALIRDPQTPLNIFAATSAGIYKSTDGGQTWFLKSVNEYFTEIRFHPVNPQIIYAASFGYTSGTGKFWRSANGGNSWQQVNMGSQSGTRLSIGVSPEKPDWVYVLLANTSQTKPFRGVFQSQNAGVSFEMKSGATNPSDPNILGRNCDGSDLNYSQAWYDVCIDVSPLDATSLTTGGINIWKSANSGVGWTINTIWSGDGLNQPCANLVHADQHVFERSPVTKTLFVGNDGGIYKQLSNGTWLDISSNLAISQVYKIGQSALFNAKTMIGTQDNGTSYTDGSSFSWVLGGDGMECIIDNTDDNMKYGELPYGEQIYRLSGSGDDIIAGCEGDNENNCTPHNGITERGAWVTPFCLHPTNPDVMFIGYRNVWRSTNVKATNPGSVNWTKISTGENNTCSVLEISQANPDILYVVRFDNSTGFSSLKKTLQGNLANPSWGQCTLPVAGKQISDLQAHPRLANVVYATVENKIYKSDNQGQSWTDFSGSLPEIPINCIGYDTTRNEGLYVGTRLGIWYRDATLNDWIEYSAGLPRVDVREIEFYHHPTLLENDRIKAATFGRGLWESPTPPVNLVSPSAFTVNLINQDVQILWDQPVNPTSYVTYNVYRNGTKLNSTPLTSCIYIDPGVPCGTYSYTVTSAYHTIESAPTGQIPVSFPCSLTVLANSYSVSAFTPVLVTAHIIGSAGMPMNNQVITFSTNGEGYFAEPVGNTATSNWQGDATVAYIPSSPGNHLITATAPNGFAAQIPQPIVVSGLPPAAATNLTSYEYWFDNNYGSRTIIGVSPTPYYMLARSIYFDDLSDGLHTLYLRFKDSKGQYSQTISQIFYYFSQNIGMKNITSYEYWFDGNISSRTVINTIPNANVQLIRSFSMNNLGKGLHEFHIRFRDSKERYSQITTRMIYYDPEVDPGNMMTTCEYWFDTDYESRINTAQTNASLTWLDEINTGSLPDGLHNFNIRFRDAKGRYSQTVSKIFYVNNQIQNNKTLISWEYWFDNNYSGRIVSQAGNKNLILLEEFSVEALSAGLHTFHIRFRDQMEFYSPTLSKIFYRQDRLPGTPATVNTYRYFFDNNFAGQKILQFPAPLSSQNLLTSIAPSGLSPGIHNLYLQFRDSTGRWSSLINSQVSISATPAVRTVTNTVVTAGQTQCYDATQTLWIGGESTPFIVHEGGAVTLIAGQKIALLPGVRVLTGGYLHGFITPEGNYCSALPPTAPASPASGYEQESNPGKERNLVRIYPNPTTGRFVVEFSGDIPNGQCFIDIYDMQGEKIMTHTINGDRRKEFSLSGKPVGVYLIRIITRDWAETVKIIKN